jgi:hypothetical protein
MIKKKYLTEVQFKNGVDEFKSYRNYTRKVTIDITDSSVSSYSIELDNKEIDEESLTVEIEGRYEVPVYWRKINGKSSNYIEVYTNAGDTFGKGEVLNLNYVALNSHVSDLYSIDYDNGLLYLANETNLELVCGCQFYNMFVTADYARQLTPDEYSTDASIASINNKIDTYKYLAVYNLTDSTDDEYITPVIRNVKVNYINTSEDESF